MNYIITNITKHNKQSIATDTDPTLTNHTTQQIILYTDSKLYLSHLRESQQCGFRTCPTQAELYKHRRWLEAGNVILRKRRNCTICEAKTKVLISEADLHLCFRTCKIWFSHYEAQMFQNGKFNCTGKRFHSQLNN